MIGTISYGTSVTASDWVVVVFTGAPLTAATTMSDARAPGYGYSRSNVGPAAWPPRLPRKSARRWATVPMSLRATTDTTTPPPAMTAVVRPTERARQCGRRYRAGVDR